MIWFSHAVPSKAFNPFIMIFYSSIVIILFKGFYSVKNHHEFSGSKLLLLIAGKHWLKIPKIFLYLNFQRHWNKISLNDWSHLVKGRCHWTLELQFLVLLLVHILFLKKSLQIKISISITYVGVFSLYRLFIASGSV